LRKRLKMNSNIIKATLKFVTALDKMKIWHYIYYEYTVYEVMYFTLLLVTKEEKSKRSICSDEFIRSNIYLLSVSYEHLCLQRQRRDVFSCIYRY
jgi:hypothetical protein